jgi:uncharacterized protein YndB with AHSA1/START domain
MNPTAQKQALMHSTFSVKRTYSSSPARVFAAFANPETKRRWFVEGEGWEIDEFSMDFRVGGRELSRFRFQGGEPTSNETVYLDIVPDQRIVFAFTMMSGNKHISISLATIEFTPAGKGTQLLYTEQGVFFDVTDKLANRKAGTRELLDKLSEELRHND